MMTSEYHVKTLFQFTIYTQPLPKQRPRFGNGKAYTPDKTKAYEDTIGWRCRAEMGESGIEAFTGDIMVRCVFGRKGKRRADLDNLTKSVLDGLNGIAYTDDKQIVSLSAKVKYGCEQPYIIISIAEFQSC